MNAYDETPLAHMRREFDAGFSREAEGREEDLVRVLRFRVAGGRYAVEIAEIGEVHELGTVTRVPGHRRGFEGITAVRGQLVAVYDLASSLGSPSQAGRARWLLVARTDRQIGFSVTAVDGYLEVPRSRLLGSAEADAGAMAAQLAIHDDEGTRLLLRLGVLIDELRRSLALEVRR